MNQNSNEAYFNPRHEELQNIDMSGLRGVEPGVGPIPPSVIPASQISTPTHRSEETLFNQMLDNAAINAINNTMPEQMEEEKKAGEQMTFAEMFAKVQRERANSLQNDSTEPIPLIDAQQIQNQADELRQQHYLQATHVNLPPLSEDSQPTVTQMMRQRIQEQLPVEDNKQQNEIFREMLQDLQRGQLLFNNEYLEEFKISYQNPTRREVETKLALASMRINIQELMERDRQRFINLLNQNESVIQQNVERFVDWFILSFGQTPQNNQLGAIIELIGRDRVRRHLRQAVRRTLEYIGHNIPVRYMDVVSNILQHGFVNAQAHNIRVARRMTAQVLMRLVQLIGFQSTTQLLNGNIHIIENILDQVAKYLLQTKLEDHIDQNILAKLGYRSKPSSAGGQPSILKPSKKLRTIQSNNSLIEMHKQIKFGLLPRQCRRIIFSDSKGQLQSYVECEWDKGNFSRYV